MSSVFTFNVSGQPMSLYTSDFVDYYPQSYLTALVTKCVRDGKDALYLQEDPEVFGLLHKAMIAGPGFDLSKSGIA